MVSPQNHHKPEKPMKKVFVFGDWKKLFELDNTPFCQEPVL